MKWMQFLTPARSLGSKDSESYIRNRPAEEITILDVRQPSEYEAEHISGAILIPLPQLPDRLDELDPEKPTLVY